MSFLTPYAGLVALLVIVPLAALAIDERVRTGGWPEPFPPLAGAGPGDPEPAEGHPRRSRVDHGSRDAAPLPEPGPHDVPRHAVPVDGDRAAAAHRRLQHADHR